MIGLLARVVTVTAAAFSVGVALLMRGPELVWVAAPAVITLVGGLVTGWKWPIYVERRLDITIKVAATAISLLWCVSLLRNKTALDFYWTMMVAALGVSYMFRQPPKPEAATG